MVHALISSHAKAAQTVQVDGWFRGNGRNAGRCSAAAGRQSRRSRWEKIERSVDALGRLVIPSNTSEFCCTQEISSQICCTLLRPSTLAWARTAATGLLEAYQPAGGLVLAAARVMALNSSVSILLIGVWEVRAEVAWQPIAGPCKPCSRAMPHTD